MFERLRGYLRAENVLRRQIDASLAKVEKPYPKVDMYQDVQYDPRTLELQQKIYPVSITFKEDPRLRDD